MLTGIRESEETWFRKTERETWFVRKSGEEKLIP
jgi:hypothetical protein